MQNQQHHQQEVRTFLQNHFLIRRWQFALPEGSGNETYFAQGNERTYFVKLGVQIEKYQAMASLGITPQAGVSGIPAYREEFNEAM